MTMQDKRQGHRAPPRKGRRNDRQGQAGRSKAQMAGTASRTETPKADPLHGLHRIGEIIKEMFPYL